MERQFWLERWQNGQIGFHLPAPHPLLVAHHGAVLRDARKVLVPLCGKTHDLTFLASRGHDVVGVELSQLAVDDYFRGLGVVPEVTRADEHTVHRYERLCIVVGDFFTVPVEFVGPCDGVYDRASLIALPAAMRAAYVASVRRLVEARARGLLVTLAFDAEGGPPFSVTEASARSAYGDALHARVATLDVTEASPNVLARGATRVEELAFELRFPG